MRLREEIAAHERNSRLQKQKEKEIKKKEAKAEAKLLKKQQRELKELIKALSYPDPFRRVWSKQEILADPEGHKAEKRSEKLARKRKLAHKVAELKEKHRIAYRKFTIKIEKAREERHQVRQEKKRQHMAKALEAQKFDHQAKLMKSKLKSLKAEWKVARVVDNHQRHIQRQTIKMLTIKKEIAHYEKKKQQRAAKNAIFRQK